MNQHIAIGATYSSVKINTTYAFGLDDPEFVLAFESDQPGDFLDLVQELRGPSRAPTRRRMCRSSPVLPRRRAACCRLSR